MKFGRITSSASRAYAQALETLDDYSGFRAGMSQCQPVPISGSLYLYYRLYHRVVIVSYDVERISQERRIVNVLDRIQL